MTKIPATLVQPTPEFYVANYAGTCDLECMREGNMDLYNLASPRGVLLLGRTEAHIKVLLDLVWQEMVVEMWDEDDHGLPMPCPDPDWETTGWKDHSNGSGAQVWSSPGQELVIVMEARKPLEPNRGPA